MERTIKFVLIIFCTTVLTGSAFCAEQIMVQPLSSLNATQTINVNKETRQPAVSPTVPQMIPFEKCTKKYMIPVDKLYFLALASINANKFFIDEIQSKNGYILFRAANRNFMVSVSKVDAKSAIIKVVPADNNYFFPLGILTNFYKYIDLNLNTPIEDLG